jgi:hypothetical protein
VVLANGSENFTMSESEEFENLFVQKNLVQLGDKEVKYMSSLYDYDRQENTGFYIVACKDYDDSIHIYKSNDLEYHLSIPRTIQPGSVNVFDLHYDDGIIHLISVKDDEFYVDFLNENQLLARLL